MLQRVEKLRALLKEKELDGALIIKGHNRKYISGFTGSAGFVLVTEDKAIFITDFRYVEQASAQCQGFEIVQINNDYPVTEEIKKHNIKVLGFEEDFVTYQQFNDFNNKLDNIELVPLEGALSKLRQIKDDGEIELISKAAHIGDMAFSHILNYIKPGVRELDLALELEYFMKKQGASGASFESIVASGKRSSLPHGVASEKLIENGDFITFDFGCIYKGYCSDMTRTVVVGKASEKQREIYDIVLEAQVKALEAIKPGPMGKEIDKIARDIITSRGYGQYFGHGLGHALGMEVHESPRLSPLETQVLSKGMVVTDEPGIYIPDFGGVRIEDLVVITEDGNNVLTKSSKELIEI
jgi:Xaa-Pro aminopeptidase